MRSTDSISFLLGFEPRKIVDLPPTTTVLQYLRRVERMTGTKEGCAEGDCGACTVVIGSAANGKIKYEAVNSCIMFLPSVHGKQLIAVEHLKHSDGTLHPVQQSMVDEHGSQCGFCTPGFVMSMFAMFHLRTQTSKEAIDTALAGNLCRCTGYAPIVRAARRMLSIDAEDQFTAAEAETAKQLARIKPSQALQFESGGQLYFAPSSKQQLCEILAQHPDSRIVAGSTDVGLWVTKQGKDLGTMVDLGAVKSLRKVEVKAGRLQIGAAASISDAMDLFRQHLPDLDELLRRYGSVQIRNRATIAGNVANGSPIGDSLPALVALQAEILVTAQFGSRTVPAEDFFIDYGVQDLKPGEFIEQVRIPIPHDGEHFRIYKLSKRYFQDISSVCGAFFLRYNLFGHVETLRICYGGMAATPKRARHCEAALLRHGLGESGLQAAQQALADDFTPLSDCRGADVYRMQAAASLIERFINDIVYGKTDSVWSMQHA